MITRALIVLNIIAFVWEVRVGGPGMLSLGLTNVSADFSRIDPYLLDPLDVRVNHQYYRIVTSAFLHGSLSHIGMNMLSLYWLGRFIEAALGAWKMLVVYFLSLVVAGIAVVLFSPPNAATLGASGAIYGLFGALFGIGLKLGSRGSELVRANVGILVLNLIFSYSFPGISWQAHIGGLIAGFIGALALFWPPRPVQAYVVDPQTGTQYSSTLEQADDER